VSSPNISKAIYRIRSSMKATHASPFCQRGRKAGERQRDPWLRCVGYRARWWGGLCVTLNWTSACDNHLYVCTASTARLTISKYTSTIRGQISFHASRINDQLMFKPRRPEPCGSLEFRLAASTRSSVPDGSNKRKRSGSPAHSYQTLLYWQYRYLVQIWWVSYHTPPNKPSL